MDKDEGVDAEVDVDTLKWQSHHAYIRYLLSWKRPKGFYKDGKRVRLL